MKKVKSYMKTIEIGKLTPDSRAVTCQEGHLKVITKSGIKKLLEKKNQIFYFVFFFSWKLKTTLES
jgi:hypothetical protein